MDKGVLQLMQDAVKADKTTENPQDCGPPCSSPQKEAAVEPPSLKKRKINISLTRLTKANAEKKKVDVLELQISTEVAALGKIIKNSKDIAECAGSLKLATSFLETPCSRQLW